MNYNIRKTTLNLFTIRILSATVFFFTIPLSVKYFGISTERDMWLLVNAFLTNIISTFFGPINDILRAKYVFLMEREGKKEASEKFSSLFIFLIFCLVVLSILIVSFPGPIKKIVAPGIGNTDAGSFVKMLYVLVPLLFIQQINNMGISILNSYNIFYIPEFVGIISGCINLVCIIVLATRIGIYSLVLSTYFSVFILFVIICFFLYNKDIHILKWPPCFSWKNVWIFLSFALPLYLSYSAGAVSNLLEKSLSNIMGRGIVSIVDYSRRFSGILQSVLTGVLATVMVPALTFAHSKRSPELFFNGFRQSLQITLIIMVLGISYIFGAANQICRLFYSHGDMDSETVHTIIILTRLFALAFIGIALSLIFGMAILSQQRGKDLGVVTVLAQVVMTVLNLLLFRTMHIYTFPITLFFSHILLSVLLFRILSITKKKEISIEILKYFGIMILLSAILIIMNDLLPEINLFFQLILNGIVLFSIFGILLYFIMKVNPLSLIKMFLKRRRSFSSEDKLI